MDTGDAILLAGAGIAAVLYLNARDRAERRQIVYVGSPFRFGHSEAQVPCPNTVLSLCPGGMPTCYVDGTVSCTPGGFRRDLSDLGAKMQEFCVSNPAVCKEAAKT